MANISLSAGVRSNLIALQSTASMLTETQGRLATGKKVNSALDNPLNFFTSQGLSNRANALTALGDGISNGIKTVQAANKGLENISKAIESANGIIAQAEAAGTAVNVVKGTASVTGATAFAGAASDALVLIDTKTNATTRINLASATTVQNVVDAVNNGTGGAFTAAIVDGKFQVTANGGSTNPVSAQVQNGATIDNAKNTTLLGGTTAVTSTIDTDVSQAKLTSYAEQLNKVFKSIKETAGDSGYNGVNLLKTGSNLRVNFNENGSSKEELSGRSFDAASLGLNDIAVTASATLDDLQAFKAALGAAGDTIESFQSELSTSLSVMQNRENFSKGMKDILQTGADNLVNADPNEEAAKLLALQTRQSLSQSALSLANQADQSVLQLLR
jgi:flagellin